MTQNGVSGSKGKNKAVAIALACALALGLPGAGSAQMMSDSYKFLEAIRKSDGDKVTSFVEAPGTTLVNTRDRTTGETALLITVARRDLTYMRYLLGHGARPDLAANDGRTPLMLAVEKRFPEGVEVLLANAANVNQANSRGETAVIRAVQMQDVSMVRLLVANGADPKKRDSMTGMSARDYAERDARIPGMIEALDAAKPVVPAKAVQGPSF
ncbi:ankyrin repeat domain-containing protein [Sphingobium sufflavum]|uniref:ankyrin repeat domain-containing protein n=1 Tax=Sphingobium sufflavum TaxID=1129547 RepID=UPI001F2B0089|nr:ankyrin repeat domain-containing protein [Sphingobium sufflavum]MCE7795059.1 ankyrin repeat domain-containing protein [Sphingobium sufflavum]